MNRSARFHRRPLLALLLAAGAALPALAHDYPTADRVVYVQACMNEHPGPAFEMLSKCSCVLDRLAGELPYDDFVTMSTATNANTIGGERGNTLRDTALVQQQIRRFRQLQSAAQKSCFLATETASR